MNSSQDEIGASREQGSYVFGSWALLFIGAPVFEGQALGLDHVAGGI